MAVAPRRSWVWRCSERLVQRLADWSAWRPRHGPATSEARCVRRTGRVHGPGGQHAEYGDVVRAWFGIDGGEAIGIGVVRPEGPRSRCLRSGRSAWPGSGLLIDEETGQIRVERLRPWATSASRSTPRPWRVRISEPRRKAWALPCPSGWSTTVASSPIPTWWTTGSRAQPTCRFASIRVSPSGRTGLVPMARKAGEKGR